MHDIIGLMDIPYSKAKDGIIIEIQVIPRSSKKEIAGVNGNIVRVKLTAPPVDGAANEQLREVLAERFGIKKGNIVILKGASSRNKTVKIINPPILTMGKPTE
jgi:hypothetical protein